MNLYVAKRGDRNGSELVRELLSYGYRELYGGEMPEIVKTEKGKPYFPARPDVFFSLSHTNTHVMCAIGDEAVGCDIQTIRPVSDRVKMKICGRTDVSLEEFFRNWTVHESLIKYHGFLDIKQHLFHSVEALTDFLDTMKVRVFFTEGCVAAACQTKSYPPEELIHVDL